MIGTWPAGSGTGPSYDRHRAGDHEGARRRARLGMDATFDGARASFEAIIPIDEQLGVRVRHRPSPRTASAARLFLAFAVAAAWQLATLAPVSARSTILPAVAPPAGLTFTAKSLLEGHTRIGTWMAIDVHVKNDGPPLTGELRLAGGAQGKTRFVTPVDAPTQSDKTYRMYIQPPGFGRELELSFVSGETTIATTTVTYAIHDTSQLIVGVVAERPGDIIGDLDLLPNANNLKPVTIAIDPASLPTRVEAWGALDRLIWQDIDADQLDSEQLAALRGWLAGGGRLVIAAGTAGASSLTGFPDDILPFRPTVTTDVAPDSLRGLLGELPSNAGDLPALTGKLIDGRVLASVGDQAVVAERSYGSGSVTILGFDPGASWLKGTSVAESLWRRLIPTRTAGGPVVGDDSQIVQAASQLPSLALPPIGGLVALIGGYILLIGPLNYLVLRRLDKREWAWVTMPALILIFAVAAYGFGSLLRGSDVIVNEVAIVRGAPGATEGIAQAYFGVFSPNRGSYQLRVPGGALLSSPVAGDFSPDGSQSSLDVVQGDPSRIRDLAVGFGSLRTVRAESAVTVPLIQTDLRLVDGHLRGTITNASSEKLLSPAVVLGSTVAKLDDLAPGAKADVDVALQTIQMGQQLSDRVVGPLFGDIRGLGDDGARLYARHTIVDQLSWDPNFGSTGTLPADGAVVLAWADHDLLPVQIEGQVPRRMGNVLWFFPTDLTVQGKTTFANDLIHNTIVNTDAAVFSKDNINFNFGRGSVEVAYQPMSFKGRMTAKELRLGFNFGDIGITTEPTSIEPLASVPPACGKPPVEGCVQPVIDGLPDIDLYDRTTGAWRRLPHLAGGERYTVVDPVRYVDPSTGGVLVRFVNQTNDQVGFSMDFTITGDVE